MRNFFLVGGPAGLGPPSSSITSSFWGLKTKAWCWEPMRHRHSPAGTTPRHLQSQSRPTAAPRNTTPQPQNKMPGLDSVQLQTPREGARFYKAPPQPATPSALPRPLPVHTLHSPRPPGPQTFFPSALTVPHLPFARPDHYPQPSVRPAPRAGTWMPSPRSTSSIS